MMGHRLVGIAGQAGFRCATLTAMVRLDLEAMQKITWRFED
jgi:hypothetical protein